MIGSRARIRLDLDQDMGNRPEGELGVLEQGSGGERRLAMAATALVELAGVKLEAPVVTAPRTHEAVRPPPATQRGGALPLGAVLGHEIGEAVALLELHAVLRHGNSPM